MKKTLVGSIMLACVCVLSQAQTTEQLSAYNAAIKSQENFNKVQREAGMPEMAVPTFEEWLKAEEAASTPSLMSIRSIPQRESIDEKMSRMRKWSNTGIRKENATHQKISDLQKPRRERLSARLAQRAIVQGQEMIEAREWARRNHVKESALLSDGRVIGLVGIRDGIPEYNITYNAGAADTVAVDKLWPSGNTGLDLTGANVLIGIWDEGDVQTNHLEFALSGNQSRIIDKDGESDIPISEHPTAVAGTMAATGVSFSGTPKGMAYQSTVWVMLVNDLDLRIVNSSGITNFPWVLNPASPSSSATTGDNYRDNTEQVVISSPSAQETYTVRITHKGDLVDDTGSVAEQAVSIILSGIEPKVRVETEIAEFVVSSTSELLEWPTVVGQNYQVQTKTNLMDQTWIDFSSEISATKTNTTWESDSAPSSTTRFYRLIETN